VTTVAIDPRVTPAPEGTGRISALRWMVADTKTVTWRYLIASTRVPEGIFFFVLQPIMFVLLFRYVFGGAIQVGHDTSYVDYLMPGIFVQTVCFGTTSTAVGLSEDLHKGLIERFRALPMARSAVLGGRTTADLLRSVVVVVVMTLVGLAVGFRVTNTFFAFMGGVLILLFFGYALSWGLAIVGLRAPNSETAQLMAFPLLFVFTFASGAFVPVSSMPGWLQAFAANQPVTIIINAVRGLMLGGYWWNLTAIWHALAWCVGLLVVLAPLAVFRYRRTV
jgi:ABC-2 type transport system permease protein/oleandomycin transport system permease protein